LGTIFWETLDGNRFKQFLIEKLRPQFIEHDVKHPVILIDNARPHYYRVVLDYLKRHDWGILERPAYSPDMNPCDFDVFYKINRRLKGILFPSPAMLVASYDQRIQDLNEAHSFPGIYNLPRVWESIIANNGSYD
jgi:transposase